MTYWSAQTSWTKILFLVTAEEAFFARLTWNLWWDLSGPDSQWDCYNKIRPAEWHSWDVLKKTYLHSQRDHLSLTKCQQLKTWQDFRLSLSLSLSLLRARARALALSLSRSRVLSLSLSFALSLSLSLSCSLILALSFSLSHSRSLTLSRSLSFALSLSLSLSLSLALALALSLSLSLYASVSYISE